MKFGIGQSVTRVEDSRLLTGNGLYTDDIYFKNQAYMYILRSPHANAKILNIDLTDSLNLPGLIKISITLGMDDYPCYYKNRFT